MTTFEAIASSWLRWMAASSWQLCLLIGVVAVADQLLRGGSPRLRYGLWLLVLLKVFLPPTLSAAWSLGHWTGLPSVPTWPVVAASTDEAASSSAGQRVTESESAALAARSDRYRPDVATSLLFVWLAGIMALGVVTAWRHAALRRSLQSAETIDEGPLRVMLEELALQLPVRRVPRLLAADVATSPFLFGAIDPWIVVPRSFLSSLQPEQQRLVLLHELLHWKHRDTWVGWVQLLAQGLFWFHPLVWWANAQLRHARECVCDESVLRAAGAEPSQYAETILQTLTVARARSLATGGLIGVFERGAKLQQRLEEIMSYDSQRRQFGWKALGGLLLFGILVLPMGPGSTAAAPDEASTLQAKESPPNTAAPTAAPVGPYPQVVRFEPESGATGVDPKLASIKVTFDRDMNQKGMSWTGGPPYFPDIDKSRKARWIDARTCELPVKLKEGALYRVGVNSTSYNNFKGVDGVAARPTPLYFTTVGAKPAMEKGLKAPTIEKIVPANEQKDVDPELKAIRVTFDVPMGGGMSWTGGGEEFPTIPKGKKARWSEDKRTCTLPVELQPGKTYRLGLNSVSHINFQNSFGVPLAPVEYMFTTGGAR